MPAAGNYVSESDVDNWPTGYTETQKQEVIDRVEEMVERATGDYFYAKAFDVKLNGNGKGRIFPSLRQDILSVTNLHVNDIEIPSTEWSYDKDSIFVSLDAEEVGELEVLFPAGNNNIRIVGTLGWPDGKLDIDNVSGIFQVGETILAPAPPGGSGATAIIKEVYPTYLKIINRSATNFVENEEIIGGTSGATADVDNVAGAVNDPPKAIKQACIILCRYENDPTLYTKYYKGTEKMGDYSYSTAEKPLAGVREADVLIRPYVRKKPMIGVV